MTFSPFPVFPNWYFPARRPDSGSTEAVMYPELISIMAPKSSLIQQRHVARVVKGALAGGFHVSAMRVDRDGAIVLFSKPSEPEAHEEPRLLTELNEWDEVLKK